MQTLFLDLETYISKDCTLSKNTIFEYVHHPEFKVHGVAYILDNGEPQFTANILEIKELIESCMLVGHNLMFDAFVLTQHFKLNVSPIYYDTMCHAKYTMSHNRSFSLNALAEHFDLGKKGAELPEYRLDELPEMPKTYLKLLPNVALLKFATTKKLDPALAATYGRSILSQSHLQGLAAYAIRDIVLTKQLYETLRNTLPIADMEVFLMSDTIKMFVDPVIVLDAELLTRAIENYRNEVFKKLEILGVEATALNSAKQFVELLAKHGATPPSKISPRTGKPIPATAKKDSFMQNLGSHKNEAVRILSDLKNQLSSNGEIIKMERLLRIATVSKVLPVPLKYAGTHTTRWGGDEKINVQSMQRGGISRKSFLAPDGYAFVVADLSQIEVRVIAYLANDTEQLQAFADHRDIYSEFASELFNTPVSKTIQPLLRQIAKAAVLACGYQVGAITLSNTLLSQNMVLDTAVLTRLNIDTLDLPDHLNDRITSIVTSLPMHQLRTHLCAVNGVVNAYRQSNHTIKKYWGFCDKLLVGMLNGVEMGHTDGVVPITYYTKKDKLIIEHFQFSYTLHYPKLENYKNNTRFEFKKNKYKSLYAGMLTNNIVQSFARHLMGHWWIETKKQTGYSPVLTVHDELLYCVPTSAVEAFKTKLRTILVNLPYSGLPLDCEIETGNIYGGIK